MTNFIDNLAARAGLPPQRVIQIVRSLEPSIETAEAAQVPGLFLRIVADFAVLAEASRVRAFGASRSPVFRHVFRGKLESAIERSGRKTFSLGELLLFAAGGGRWPLLISSRAPFVWRAILIHLEEPESTSPVLTWRPADEA
jgi:hypothetical protein